jgi:hypothetical protein
MSRAAWFGFVVSFLSAACGSSYPESAPLAPTSPLSPAPGPTVSRPDVGLTGTVYDNVSRPIAGASVEVLDGSQAGLLTISDASGRFAFLTGAFDDSIRVRASKAGHRPLTRTSSINCPTCSRYVGFLLEVDATPVDATGDYTMTFVADPTCQLPENVRIRRYDARVSRDDKLNWHFQVSITNASVMHDYTWDGVFIDVAGSFVSMGVGNLHGSPGLVEQVSPDVYVGFDGVAGGEVSASRLITMSAAFDGTIEACKQQAGSASPVATGMYSCPREQRVQCSSGNHRFTITRR